MEDNLTPQDTFAPSIFDTAREMAQESSLASPIQESPNKIDIDLDTSKTLVEIPFEIVSYLTKTNDIKLTESEIDKLGKLWRCPLQRILSQYENSDIAVAAIATLGIAGEKYLEYQLEQQRRNRTGNEGKRENELHKVEAA